MRAVLLLTMLATGCASNRGAMTMSVPFEQKATCERGEVLMREIDVNTDWETQHQTVVYSWQCYVDDRHNHRMFVKIIDSDDWKKP